MNEEYKKALKDGRWQIRKTEIMQRDGFACVKCGASASDGVVLNVHHLNYYPDRNPWEYEDNDLITLCENCHKKVHKQSSPKENYWDYNDLEKLKGKFVHIEDGLESHICLFGIEVSNNHEHPDSIEAMMIASGVYPYYDTWEFSGLNSGIDIEYKNHVDVNISHSDKVTILEGDLEKRVLEDMIWGVSNDLSMITDQQKWAQGHDANFFEASAKCNREVYKHVFYILCNHLLHIRYKDISSLKLEIIFMKRYVKTWSIINHEDGKNLSVREIVKAYLRDNNIDFAISETKWVFDIIEEHKDNSEFDFIHFAEHTKDLNLTNLQIGFIEEIKELDSHKLGRGFVLKEAPEEKVEKIKHLLLDLHLDSLELRLKDIMENLKVIKDTTTTRPLLSEFVEIKKKRDHICSLLNKDIRNMR